MCPQPGRGADYLGPFSCARAASCALAAAPEGTSRGPGAKPVAVAQAGRCTGRSSQAGRPVARCPPDRADTQVGVDIGYFSVALEILQVQRGVTASCKARLGVLQLAGQVLEVLSGLKLGGCCRPRNYLPEETTNRQRQSTDLHGHSQPKIARYRVAPFCEHLLTLVFQFGLARCWASQVRPCSGTGRQRSANTNLEGAAGYFRLFANTGFLGSRSSPKFHPPGGTEM